MSLLIVVPGLICLFLVSRERIETAFLSVYLPCLLMLPQSYSVRLPHLPPISAAEFALIPLGFVGIFRLIRKGSFAVMDLLVLLYTASIGLSEILHASVSDGLFSAMDAFISMFMAYAAGRTLIEPDLRLATVRRFVTLVLLDAPGALYEWRMGQSLYGLFGDRVLHISIDQGVQIRNGRPRIGTVFSGGETAGIAFAITFCLNAWLVYLRRVKAAVDLGKALTTLEKYHLPELLLLLSLLLTQARGPMIALGAGFLILQIPRFKYTRLMTIVVAIMLAVGYIAVSAYFDSYTSVSGGNVASEQQGSAVYRREMNKVYPPIAEKGGWTGYSVLGIPHVGGQNSIDNHYLLVHLAWGRLGYYLLLLIVWANVLVMLQRSWQLKALQDRAFVFSMLAAMAVLWITLLTVFLGGQLPQLSFLLIGWMQSTGQPTQTRRFSFRRVFT
jgi:hypothetical protein